MGNNREKLLLFNEYLKAKECEIQLELKPFYERYAEREESGGNSYGVATPHDKVLLQESVSIQELRQKIGLCDSLEELVKKMKKEIEASSGGKAIFDYQRQLKYIDQYLENNEKTSIIPDSNITDLRFLSKEDTLNSLLESPILMEDNSNKMKS